MIKLSLKIIVLTVLLEGAALVFVDEFILTTLILVTMGLVAVRLVLGSGEPADDVLPREFETGRNDSTPVRMEELRA